MTKINKTKVNWILLCLLLSSCSTHENDTILAHTGLIKREITNTTDTLNYLYDDLGRLIKTERPIGQKTIWDYRTEYIIKKEICQFGEIWYIDTLIFNEMGLTGSQKRYIKKSHSNIYDPLAIYSYSYDNNKYLIELKIQDLYFPKDSSMRVIEYVVVNGNVTSKKSFIENKPEENIYTEYTFYLDKVNSIGNISRGTSFFGMSDEHPISKKTAYVYSNPPEIKTYSYIFINEKIFRKTEIDLNGVIVNTWDYEYY